jgi:hypothetical protein
MLLTHNSSLQTGLRSSESNLFMTEAFFSQQCNGLAQLALRKFEKVDFPPALPLYSQVNL